MNNQEKFLNAEMLWDGDRYHWSLDDAICHFHEVEGLEEGDYPISLELCEKHFGLAQAASDVAECIRDEPLANASDVAEEFLEVLYFDCDDWADEYISMGCVGVEELDWAISIFKSVNHWVYLLFGSSSRFKPGRDVIGLWFLDRALQRFERAQRDRHSVWYPSKPKIEWDLPWEFVQEYLKGIENKIALAALEDPGLEPFPMDELMTTASQSDQNNESTDQPPATPLSFEEKMRIARGILKKRHELFKRLAGS